ncbi:hypothetical protein DCCM_1986 [Desulfocucumis palustris]|uniref:Uncharacterized protein n=1 Tax=Desulfocucumis palustris TaxID=1898651 RepID=A0A2L2X9H6_9FIRM|nr:hypothetical protein [Desulfocucumis palustris]GBF32889.1 hypothetical protein DCCM_1986 [Desulfocucumis palustris]
MDWQELVKKALADLLLVGLLSTAAIACSSMIQQTLSLPAEEKR